MATKIKAASNKIKVTSPKRGSGNFQKAVWLGKKPPDKSQAWRYLSGKAKKILAEERAKGHFGGTPTMAPYWLSQDQGNPEAAIEPLQYLRKAMKQFDSTLSAKVDAFFGGKL